MGIYQERSVAQFLTFLLGLQVAANPVQYEKRHAIKYGKTFDSYDAGSDESPRTNESSDTSPSSVSELTTSHESSELILTRLITYPSNDSLWWNCRNSSRSPLQEWHLLPENYDFFWATDHVWPTNLTFAYTSKYEGGVHRLSYLGRVTGTNSQDEISILGHEGVYKPSTDEIVPDITIAWTYPEDKLYELEEEEPELLEGFFDNKLGLVLDITNTQGAQVQDAQAPTANLTHAMQEEAYYTQDDDEHRLPIILPIPLPNQKSGTSGKPPNAPINPPPGPLPPVDPQDPPPIEPEKPHPSPEALPENPTIDVNPQAEPRPPTEPVVPPVAPQPPQNQDNALVDPVHKPPPVSNKGPGPRPENHEQPPPAPQPDEPVDASTKPKPNPDEHDPPGNTGESPGKPEDTPMKPTEELHKPGSERPHSPPESGPEPVKQNGEHIKPAPEVLEPPPEPVKPAGDTPNSNLENGHPPAKPNTESVEPAEGPSKPKLEDSHHKSPEDSRENSFKPEEDLTKQVNEPADKAYAFKQMKQNMANLIAKFNEHEHSVVSPGDGNLLDQGIKQLEESKVGLQKDLAKAIDQLEHIKARNMQQLSGAQKHSEETVQELSDSVKDLDDIAVRAKKSKTYVQEVLAEHPKGKVIHEIRPYRGVGMVYVPEEGNWYKDSDTVMRDGRRRLKTSVETPDEVAPPLKEFADAPNHPGLDPGKAADIRTGGGRLMGEITPDKYIWHKYGPGHEPYTDPAHYKGTRPDFAMDGVVDDWYKPEPGEEPVDLYDRGENFKDPFDQSKWDKASIGYKAVEGDPEATALRNSLLAGEVDGAGDTSMLVARGALSSADLELADASTGFRIVAGFAVKNVAQSLAIGATVMAIDAIAIAAGAPGLAAVVNTVATVIGYVFMIDLICRALWTIGKYLIKFVARLVSEAATIAAEEVAAIGAGSAAGPPGAIGGAFVGLAIGLGAVAAEVAVESNHDSD